MDLKEIRKVVEEIKYDIQKNKYEYTHRKYEVFFSKIGMPYRRNFTVLDKIDDLFKKHDISLWHKAEPVEKLEDLVKGHNITFRFFKSTKLDDTKGAYNYPSEVRNEDAGTISIAQVNSGLRLYDHQKEAIQKLDNTIVKSLNFSAGILALPTGGGKTLTAAYWICKNILNKDKKVLWIAHRHELLEQAKNTFSTKLAYNDIFTGKDRFSYRIISGNHDKPVNIKNDDDIIFSSKDSLSHGFKYLNQNWLKGYKDEIFLVVDEAHHATAKTYRKLIENLNSVAKVKVLGLTATPFRTAESEQGLLKKVFTDDIIAKEDLRTLISRGILSEPHFEEVPTGQNFLDKYNLNDKQLDDLNSNFGDFSNTLGDAITRDIAQNRERNNVIVSHYKNNKLKYKQTVVFALNVDNAIALNKLFKSNGIQSDYVVSSIKDANTGVTISAKENKNKIDRFRSGDLNVLINVNILSEGTDLPKVQSVFLTRPTKSKILMTQMLGRGLRGPKAGGTKEAYIVSFVDEWQSKITWVNPEKLYIEDNVDFKDASPDTKERIVRLVAISKIEEFAILNDQIIEPKVKEELEKLTFVERVPLGIYHFKLLNENQKESGERNVDVLVYDNVQQSYKDFINALSDIFSEEDLTKKNYLNEEELDQYSEYVEEKFFYGCLKYPAYHLQDIKDILQYYAIHGHEPQFVEFKDREKYNIDSIAEKMIKDGLSDKKQIVLLNHHWENDETSWKAFFNYDKKRFISEISLAKQRALCPELYQRSPIVPEEVKELRHLEKLSLYEMREHNPQYAKFIADRVFRKFTDEEGYYFSAKSGFKSKNKLAFQIDHIKPMHKGGLTVLDNLQILTRKENAKKGHKY